MRPPRAKKLYIETVGCQMNLLDSELVVGKLRNEGYELTDDIGQADTILYNTCSVRQHAEDKIYSALGRIKNLKRDRPRRLDRRPRLHGPEGPGADPQAGPSRQRGDRPRPARAGLRAARPRPGSTASPRWPSACPGPAARATPSPPASPSTTRSASRRCGPSPFQAFVRIMMGCDKFCTYCIVPSVRGPEQSRPPDAIVARGPDARRPGGQGDHPPRPDRQQLQVHASPTAGPPGSRTSWSGSHEIDGRRADQVHHQLPQRHDRRPPPGRPRPAQGLALPPRPRAERAATRS